MKYLKAYESKSSHKKDILDNKDDIIKVLADYYSIYDDNITSEIEDLIWETDPSAARMQDIDDIDEECIRLLLSNLDSLWESGLKKILDIYNNCKYFLDKRTSNIDDIKDIFLEYSDIGKVSVTKSSDKHDDRYVINIEVEDILMKIDFQEVLGRMRDIAGLSDYTYSGGFDNLIIEFYKKINDED